MNSAVIPEELKIDSQNITELMMSLINDYGVKIVSDYTRSITKDAYRYIEEHITEPDIRKQLIDIYDDIEAHASEDGYKKGFKEGVRISRAVMITL